jgi:hypothetical protein
MGYLSHKRGPMFSGGFDLALSHWNREDNHLIAMKGSKERARISNTGDIRSGRLGRENVPAHGKSIVDFFATASYLCGLHEADLSMM